MEKRITRKVEDYLSSFKQDIKKLMVDYHLHETDNGKLLLQSILDKPNLSFTPEDFIKRQRAKNTVNILERCSAKRANGELCSRKKKKNSIFCGTHCKGTPYGSIDNPNNLPTTNQDNLLPPTNPTPPQQKINIFTIEVEGIIYYIDDNNNAYSMEDILLNKNNPQIIGTIHNDNGTTHIISNDTSNHIVSSSLSSLSISENQSNNP
jgi:hypothetical protein